MNTTIKGAALVALAAMGLTLSACGGEQATAKPAEPDTADLTAAAIDNAPATPAPAAAPTETATAPAH